MKTIKYVLSLFIALSLFTGCEKDDNLDFLNSITAPTEVSAVFNILQDNSGTVTITPNAIGASTYSMILGDETEEPVTVLQGESAVNIYAEGTYTVTIKAVNINGLETEVTQQLVVAFRAPENLEIMATIDASNPFQINVSAEADFAASFEVFFDTSNTEEEATPLALGETVSFEYPLVGDYTVRVVALSGGVETIEATVDITIETPTELPIDFEIFDSTAFIGFGGASADLVDNPDMNGNESAKVAQIIKGAPEVWAGNVIELSAPIDFSTKKIIKFDVWSPRPGGTFTLKLENLDDANTNIEKEVTLVGNSAWEEVSIDFSDVADLDTKTYQKIVWFFDLGTVGDGSADWTFYVDNIKQIGSAPSGFPINFDPPYEISSFDGGEISIANNPDMNGNASSTVAQLIKGDGQTWAGSKITIDSPYSLQENLTVTAKVWSPRVGLNLLMKFEDAQAWPNTVATDEITATTTVANAWEELTFVLTGVDSNVDYLNLVLIMDNGTSGDGSDNFKIFVDDISVVSFLDFEALQQLSSFDGGEISVVDNPDTNGNTSSMVAKMVKGAGQTWAGSKITKNTPFLIDNSTTITLKVWSPRVGLDLLIKFEDTQAWPNTVATDEITATTTVANAWEELTFVLTGVDPNVDYLNLVLIMDNGTSGDGSADYTIYVDNISNN